MSGLVLVVKDSNVFFVSDIVSCLLIVAVVRTIIFGVLQRASARLPIQGYIHPRHQSGIDETFL